LLFAATLFSAAELACKSEAGAFLAAVAVPVVLASPLVLAAFLVEPFAFAMDDLLQESSGDWMLSAHRQREDHSDLHRWHNNPFILASRSVERERRGEENRFSEERFRTGVSGKAFQQRVVSRCAY
jgi:hypothetical protein